MTAAPSNDVQSETAIEGFDYDPVAAFFSNLVPGEDKTSTGKEEKEVPVAEGAVETPEETAETTEGGAPEETEKTTEDPAAEAKDAPTDQQRRQAADDDEVIVQVGDEAKRVSVKDLKRLFGQEASLTQKSQQAAETRKALDAEAARYSAGLAKMAKEAADRWAEYEKVDYLIAKDALAPEAFAKLRQDALAAHQANEFFKQEASAFQQQAQQRTAAVVREAAQASLKVIRDPTTPQHIPDWSDDTYRSILEFGAKMGAPADVLRHVTEPWALKMMHLAMQQAKAAETAAAVKVARPTVKASPKAVLTNTETAQTPKGDKKSRAAARLAQTGDVDDAAAAFLAGWEVE